MAHHWFRGRALVRSVTALFVVLATAQALAQGSDSARRTAPAQSAEQAEVSRASVIIDGSVLFEVRGLSAFPADQRARGIEDRIRALAANSAVATPMLTLDEQGNGHYEWKGGRFETQTLVGQTWQGTWFQQENDRDGGFNVEFSPDFTEGEGRWWYSRIGIDHAPTQKGGTFHLSKRAALMSHSDTPPAP